MYFKYFKTGLRKIRTSPKKVPKGKFGPVQQNVAFILGKGFWNIVQINLIDCDAVLLGTPRPTHNTSSNIDQNGWELSGAFI